MTTFALSYPLTQDSTPNFGIPQGTAGRGGYPLLGICLHELGMTMEQYIAYAHTRRTFAQVRPGEHGSVHYAVEVGGAIHQFITDSNTAWGSRQLNSPTWSLLAGYPGVDANYLLLHIGLESFYQVAPPPMYNALAELIAYVAMNNGLTIDATTLITHDQLDTNYAQCLGALLPNLIATVNSLLANYQPVLPNIVTLNAQVQALQTQVDALQADFTAWQSQVAALVNHPSTIAQAATLGHIESSSTLAVDPALGTATTVQNAAVCTVAASQTLVANIESIVQFGTVLSAPANWVTLGAFQHVNVLVNGLYRLRARLQFAAATWTAGRTLQLDVFKNNSLFRTLRVKTIEANLTGAVVEVAGECGLLVTSATDYYDVRVTTNDTNASKSIAAGDFIIEKVGA